LRFHWCNAVSAVSEVFHLFSPKTNLLFHDVPLSTSFDAPFTVAVQKRTVMFVAFEVRSHPVITTKSTRWLAFLFNADQLVKWRILHFSSPVASWQAQPKCFFSSKITPSTVVEVIRNDSRSSWLRWIVRRSIFAHWQMSVKSKTWHMIGQNGLLTFESHAQNDMYNEHHSK